MVAAIVGAFGSPAGTDPFSAQADQRRLETPAQQVHKVQKVKLVQQVLRVRRETSVRKVRKATRVIQVHRV